MLEKFYIVIFFSQLIQASEDGGLSTSVAVDILGQIQTSVSSPNQDALNLREAEIDNFISGLK